MAKRKYDFTEEDKIKTLLWCGKHCCLCNKFTGIGIEVAHLENEKSDIDNAIPLCFDCHASIGHYNAQHPRGKKYSINELKERRNQVYELHTRHLLSPVNYKLTQENYELPHVGFSISNYGNTYPVKACIKITIIQGEKDFGSPETKGHYDGRFLWNLNPQNGVNGHFPLPKQVLENKKEPVRVLVRLTLYDIYERPHELLPSGYIKNLQNNKDWYFEPCLEELQTKSN